MAHSFSFDLPGDPAAAVAETLAVFNDLVKAGKLRRVRERSQGELAVDCISIQYCEAVVSSTIDLPLQDISSAQALVQGADEILREQNDPGSFAARITFS